jgi:hypothetical protein
MLVPIARTSRGHLWHGAGSSHMNPDADSAAEVPVK